MTHIPLDSEKLDGRSDYSSDPALISCPRCGWRRTSASVDSRGTTMCAGCFANINPNEWRAAGSSDDPNRSPLAFSLLFAKEAKLALRILKSHAKRLPPAEQPHWETVYNAINAADAVIEALEAAKKS